MPTPKTKTTAAVETVGDTATSAKNAVDETLVGETYVGDFDAGSIGQVVEGDGGQVKSEGVEELGSGDVGSGEDLGSGDVGSGEDLGRGDAGSGDVSSEEFGSAETGSADPCSADAASGEEGKDLEGDSWPHNLQTSQVSSYLVAVVGNYIIAGLGTVVECMPS